jgi:integrase
MAKPRYCGKDKYGADVWEVAACGGPDGAGGYVRKRERVHGTKRQAELRQAELRLELARGVPRGDMTVAEWFDAYLNTHGRQLSPLTIQCYRALARLRVLPALGSTKLVDVTPRRIMQILDGLDRHKRKDGKPGTVSAATKGKYYRFMHVLFAKAVYRGLLQSNPVDAVQPPKGERVEAKCLTRDEMRLVLDALAHEPLSVQVLFRLALTTGLRRGELIALRWTDIDLTTGKIRVERAVCRAGDGQGLGNTKSTPAKVQIVKPTKTARGVRTVYTTPDTCEALRTWKAEAGQHPDGYVFVWPDGDWFHVDFATKAWGKFLARVNARLRDEHEEQGGVGEPPQIGQINFHGCRHTYVSTLLMAGMPAHEVASVGGHAPETMLRVYSHIMYDTSARARDAFQATFAANPPANAAKDAQIEHNSQDASVPS